MNGGKGYIKDEIVPLLDWDYDEIETLLQEISDNTNIKRFKAEGRWWIESLFFNKKHQNLRKDRMPPDICPSFVRQTPGRCPQNVRTKYKYKYKGKKKERVIYGEEFFDKVWSNYPDKVKRKEALRHFTASVKTEKDFTDIQTALENYKARLESEPTRPTQNGSTWFNNWRDWIDASSQIGRGRPLRGVQATKQNIASLDKKMRALTQQKRIGEQDG